MTDKGIVITGEGIDIYRLLSLRSALKLESVGIRMSRGVSVLKVIKLEFPNLARKTAALTLPVFSAYVDEQSKEFKAKGAPGIETV